MHRPTGHIAPYSERAAAVGSKIKARFLSWISLDRQIIGIDVQSMNDICADQLQSDSVARVYSDFTGCEGVLTGFDTNGSLGWPRRRKRKGEKCNPCPHHGERYQY